MKTFFDTKSLPFLIDCDPGADDVFALLWSLVLHNKRSTPLQLKAITTVGGNVSSDHTYSNAFKMLEFTGTTDIPVGKDMRPVMGSADASHIHGEDGIGWLSSLLPPVNLPSETLDSVDLIIKTIKENPGLTILATGPLTNLAAAERKEPGILTQCQYIIAMGGASQVGGNVTPVAEFNIWYDAPSADIVVKACNNLILIPLDVTTSFVYSPEETEAIVGQVNHSTKAQFIRELTQFTINTNRKFRETHYDNGFFVHDAHTIWFLAYPHLYKGSFVDLAVETVGEHTKWQTVVDRRNHPRSNINKTLLITDVDRNGILEAMTEDLKEFDFE